MRLRIMRLLALVLNTSLIATALHAQTPSSRDDRTPAIIVSDGMIAIKIVMAVASPIYGDKMIEAQSPFRAVLEGGVWQVQGNIEGKYKGKSLYAEVRANTGEILKLTSSEERRFYSVEKPRTGSSR